ncbi:hypothetical protein GQ472_01945 [archaeon]|nr:hypothetical protein [archaeon]
MRDKIRITGQPHKMWAVFRRCTTYTEWSLQEICEESTARAMLRFEDFVGGKMSNTVRLIGLERQILPVTVTLKRRRHSKAGDSA